MSTVVRMSVRDLPAWERAFGAAVPKAMRAGLRLGGEGVRRLMQSRTTAQRIRDLGGFASGWRAVGPRRAPGGESVRVLNAAPHAVYVERGRRAGARPPPARALFGWCERHLGSAGLAWALAQAISKRGIRARPVMLRPDEPQASAAVVLQSVMAQLDALLKRGGA